MVQMVLFGSSRSAQRSKYRFLGNAAVVCVSVAGLALWAVLGPEPSHATAAVHLKAVTAAPDEINSFPGTPQLHRMLESASQTCGERIAEKYGCE